jgi:NADPH:quinone reductase-like Zn-dependent oxidoreductase
MRDLMDRMFGWYTSGEIKPVNGEVFRLDQFQDAMAAVLGRKSLGRVALVMGEEAKRHGLA